MTTDPQRQLIEHARPAATGLRCGRSSRVVTTVITSRWPSCCQHHHAEDDDLLLEYY
jgi:hypothetical protein